MEQDFIRNNIKILRQHLKISQKEMADRLDVDRNTYRNIETGKTKLINPMLDKIAEVCGVPTETLIVGTVCFPEDLEKLQPLGNELQEEPITTYSLNQIEMVKRHHDELMWIKYALLSLSKQVNELQASIDELTKENIL